MESVKLLRKTSDEAPLQGGGGKNSAPLALPRRCLLLPALALVGLSLLGGCASAHKNSQIDTDAGRPKTWQHVRRGENYLDKKEYRQAEKEFREAIRLSPDWAVGYGYLAIALENQGKYRETEKVLKRLVKGWPDQGSIRYRYGMFLYRQRRYKEAEVEFREVQVLVPDPFDSEFYKCLARCLDAEGKGVEARLYWEKALELEKHPKKTPFIPRP